MASAGPLAGQYDLILSFDYESINTTIQQTARDLKEKLATVGLGPGQGEMLHIVAHSMGGLVSRWFIEREGGNLIVQHLVMLGTPNGGSPWPRLQNWATATLALALNGLTAMVWPAAALGSLVAAIERVNVALDQMIAGSEFLTELATSPDPKVAYTLIAGDTAIKLAAPPQPELGGMNLVQRLLGRLSAADVLRVAADQVFFAPNDIAVSVSSMTRLGADRIPALAVQPAACDQHVLFPRPGRAGGTGPHADLCDGHRTGGFFGGLIPHPDLATAATVGPLPEAILRRLREHGCRLAPTSRLPERTRSGRWPWILYPAVEEIRGS